MKYTLIYFIPAFIILLSCKKENPTTSLPEQPPLTPEVQLWERAIGDYKVYDLQGNFLYDMQITHSEHFDSTGNRIDSLFFLNFDNQYSLGNLQKASDYYSDFVRIGTHTVVDSNSLRWKVSGWVGYTYDNNIKNGQIPLRFVRMNTPFYLEDSVPHSAAEIKQLAIKQP